MMHKSVYLALFGILSASCGMSMMFSRFEKFFAITFLNEFQSVSFWVLLHTGFGWLVSVHHRSWMLCSWFLDFIFCYLNDFPTSHQLLIAFLTPGLVCCWYFLVRVSIWLSFLCLRFFLAEIFIQVTEFLVQVVEFFLYRYKIDIFTHLLVELLINLFLCECVSLCVLQTHEYEDVSMYTEAKSKMSHVFLSHSLPCVFETGSFTEPETSQCVSVPQSWYLQHARIFMWVPRLPTQVLMLAEQELLLIIPFQ